ncbi:MAG: transposase [Spirochaetaceae bacterium]|nr:transposase [Spirochaetaceae bacterium]
MLGLWISENEGAKFWMRMLNNLYSHGVKEILIACMDGLTGFPEAIRAVFLYTRVQLCIVHMVRNSAKYVLYKYMKKVCTGLRELCEMLLKHSAEHEAGKCTR